MTDHTLLERHALLAALEGKRVGWFADSHEHAKESFELILGGLRALEPRLVRKATRACGDRRIETSAGGVITFWSTRCAGGGRGHILDVAFADNVPGHRLDEIRPALVHSGGKLHARYRAPSKENR